MLFVIYFLIDCNQEAVLISPLEDEDKEENMDQDNNSHSTTSTLNIDQGK